MSHFFIQIDLMQLSEGELMLATSALQGLTGEADKLTPNLLTDVSTVVKGVVNVASPTEAAVADTSNTTNATKPSDTTGVAFTTLLKVRAVKHKTQTVHASHLCFGVQLILYIFACVA